MKYYNEPVKWLVILFSSLKQCLIAIHLIFVKAENSHFCLEFDDSVAIILSSYFHVMQSRLSHGFSAAEYNV